MRFVGIMLVQKKKKNIIIFVQFGLVSSKSAEGHV